MDDFSMLSMDASENKLAGGGGIGLSTTTGADNDEDDDTFLNHPFAMDNTSITDMISYGGEGNGNNSTTNMSTTANVTIAGGEDTNVNNLGNPREKMDGQSILHGLIGAALSLSTRTKVGNSTPGAVTAPNNQATDSSISSSVPITVSSSSNRQTSQGLQHQEDGIDEEEQRPLVAATMKDIHELREDIHELLRQQREEMEQALQKQEALHRQEIQELKHSTSQRSGMLATMRGHFSSVVFTPFRDMGHAGGGLAVGASGGGGGGDDEEDYALEQDVYSLMMLNTVTEERMPSSPFWRRIKKYAQRLCLAVGIVICVSLWYTALTRRPTLIDFDFSTTIDEFGIFLFMLILWWWAMSSAWFLGIITFFCFQLFLGFFFLLQYLIGGKEKCEQNRSSEEEVCIPFDLPTGFDPIVTFMQYCTGILVLATQTDILTSILNVLHLRNADHIPWDRVVGVEGNRTWRLWMTRILLPNVLKFIQAFVVLCASFMVIIKGQEIVELLKDFTAVLVVSQSDNILFSLADMGYLGRNLARKTAEVKAIHWNNSSERERGGRDDVEGDQPMVEVHGSLVDVDTGTRTGTGGGCISRFSRFCRPVIKCFDVHVFIFGVLSVMMIGGITFIKVLQYSGTLTRMKYPDCLLDNPRYSGNGICGDIFPENTAQCGYSGGDCGGSPKPVEGYPDCFVLRPYLIGDGECWESPPYNTPECGFDGGDCMKHQGLPVDGYPDCFVSDIQKLYFPTTIGNGVCDDYPPYNTKQCGFDGGDCERNAVDGYVNCFVHYTGAIGDGHCDNFPPYNTEVCGFDGGDCGRPIAVDGYPDCFVHYREKIGDGECWDLPPYNSEECGFDGGDCL